MALRIVLTNALVFALSLVGSSSMDTLSVDRAAGQSKLFGNFLALRTTANASAGACTGFVISKIAACSYNDCKATCDANHKAKSMGLCTDTHLKGSGVQYLCDRDSASSVADSCIVWIPGARGAKNTLQTLVNNGEKGAATRLMKNFVNKCTPAELTAMDTSSNCALIKYYQGFGFKVPEREQSQLDSYRCGHYYPKMEHA